MIKFQLLKKNLAVFQCMAGLNLVAFYELLLSFESAMKLIWISAIKKRDRKRLRDRGGGRNGALSNLEDKLLFFYFKISPVQEVQAMFSEWVKHKRENGPIA